MNFFNILAGSVKMPEGGNFLGDIILGLLKGVYGLVGDYGVAILLFTLVLRLIMFPLDFGNKYFTKKNAQKSAEYKPEIDKIAKQYPNDMMARNRAQQEVYRKHGHKQGGFCFFMIINLVVTMAVFLTVFGCLRDTSNFNINRQFVELQAVHAEYDVGGSKETLGLESEEFKKEINNVYNDTTIPFLWVKNIWRPDNWASQTMSWSEFKSAVSSVKGNVFESLPKSYFDPEDTAFEGMSDKQLKEEREAARAVYENDLKAQYAAIFDPIKTKHTGWNGYLILVLLAGATMYFSAVINANVMKKKADEKKADEPVVQYSMRNAKEEVDGAAMPQVNPAMMGNVMKIVLPLIMVVFTLTQTAALALYIAFGALVSIGLTFISNAVIDKILAKQEKKKNPFNKDEVVINPHTKYFKKNQGKR